MRLDHLLSKDEKKGRFVLSVLRVQGAWFASALMHRKEADAQLDAEVRLRRGVSGGETLNPAKRCVPPKNPGGTASTRSGKRTFTNRKTGRFRIPSWWETPANGGL